MSNPYEKTIADIKHDYTKFLTNIITPFIYEGMKSVYIYAVGGHNEYVEAGKYDPEITSPGILKLFQLSLKEIPILNNNTIENETNRIKAGSKCAPWFDQLVKATIKSHIVLYTFTNPNKIPHILKEKHHEKIDVKDFVHKCYIESARSIYNNPELFWHELPTMKIKKNQILIIKLIRKAIEEAIKKCLPMELVLNEYLSNDYLYFDEENNMRNNVNQSKYANIKDMLKHKNKRQHKSSPSGTEEDYMADTHTTDTSNSSTYQSSYNKSSKSSKSSPSDYMASQKSSQSSSNDTPTNSNEEEEHENTKNFLKDIETQLHNLDNTIKTVKAVQPSPKSHHTPTPNPNPNDPHTKSKPTRPTDSPKKNENIFEEIEQTNNEQQPLPKQKTSSQKPPLPNIPQQTKIANFEDPMEKPKKLTKKDKMFLEELEHQINQSLNN